MNIFILVLSIYGLSFLIKESDGPFGIMNSIRNRLITNKYLGVFFYKLLSCYFCVGCHAGWIIYLLSTPRPSLNYFFIWTMAGGAIGLIFNALLEKLYK
jgi:hypothetical protein